MKSFREPVIRLILLLVALFFTALGAIAIQHYLMANKLAEVGALQKNEQSRLEMTYLLHIELQKIQTLFQNMFLCRTETELDFINRQIQSSVGNVQNFISVIEKGGTTTHAYKVNFKNEEEIRQVFSYRHYRERGADEINMDVFELKSKVADLLKHQKTFNELVSRKIKAGGVAPRELEQKTLFFYKGIDPYFQRIFETSYRNYFSARAEMQRLADVLKKTEQTYLTGFYMIIAVVCLLIIGLTALMLANISRILRERAEIQNELGKTNENLEKTVEDRTRNLLNETNERIRAEEEAKRRADFLRTIIDSLAHPFYVVDVDTHEVVMLNEYARQLNPEKSRYCYSLTHDRDSACGGDEHPCPIVEVMSSEKPVTLEHVHYDLEGKRIYVEVHGYPVFDAGGKLTRMIEYSLDITKKKLAEIALEETNRNLEKTVRERTLNLEEEIGRRQAMQVRLEESEHYYRTLIESSNDLIIILSMEGDVTYVSPSVKVVLGYSPESLAGKSLYDYIHPDDAGLGKDNFLNFLSALPPDQHPEHRIRAADGQYRVLESSFRNLIADETIEGILVTARDVTARREAESLMRKLQLVIEQSPNSVAITDRDGTIEYVNPQFERMTGYSKSEALGQNPRILKSGLTPPQTHIDLWNAVASGNIWQGEFANRNKAGEIYYENVVIAPLKDAAGEVTHFVAMKENITELKKAREQAEASNKAKSQFLSRMSHELRTPLNAINGFSKLLMESSNPLPAPRHLEYARQINTAGYHLLELINEILDLSRIESGRISLSVEDVQPIEAVKSCISLVESMLFDNKVSVNIDETVAPLPLLTVDLTRFKQVVLNLLTNAVKYNRPGGVVTISGFEENGMATISVADTGIGIPPEKHQDVFTPFNRLGQETLAIEGTGIGLTITKQIVEIMGGKIGFESIPGQGSTFWVAFPVSENKEGKTVSPASDPDRRNLGDDAFSVLATILYVEDDAVNILLMKEIMKRWTNYTLVVRKSAEKGIEAARLLNPDLILMDITLPGISGIDAFLLLQQKPETHDIPVVALSANFESETVKRCLDLGFYDYLCKPLDIRVLQVTIASALKGEKR